MTKPTLAIVLLVLSLVGSNAWWAYHSLDAGVSKTYLGVSLEDNKEALKQTLELIPFVAQAGHSKSEIIETARKATSQAVPFEKDGFVWVGKIGLKFNNQDHLIEVSRAWSPP